MGESMGMLLLLCLTTLAHNATAFQKMGFQSSSVGSRMQRSSVPSSGIIDYIGSTIPRDNSLPRWSTDEIDYQPPTEREIKSTRFNLFRQLPWKKIRGKVVLKAKISGSLPLTSTPSGGLLGFGASAELELVDSLEGLQNLLNYASVDPRVQAVMLEIGTYVLLRPCDGTSLAGTSSSVRNHKISHCHLCAGVGTIDNSFIDQKLLSTHSGIYVLKFTLM